VKVRRALVVAAALAVAASSGAMFRSQAQTQVRAAAPFADVTLVDQTGARVTFGRFAGRRLLVGFATASEGAAGACASISGKFAYLQHRIDPRRVHLLQISADPAGDSTPGVLRAYARAYGIEGSRWTVASGNVADISAIDAKLVQAAQAARIGDIFGSAVAVIDERGRLLAVLDASTQTPDRLLREALNH
jgi:cytochrome oxidase Cu insertion factor (SCO1/SenC/PrrC family)